MRNWGPKNRNVVFSRAIFWYENQVLFIWVTLQKGAFVLFA
jgi:hypothetical protein